MTEDPTELCDFCEGRLAEGVGLAMWAERGRLLFDNPVNEGIGRVPDQTFLICSGCRGIYQSIEDVRSGSTRLGGP
jgi:hypothetical protein